MEHYLFIKERKRNGYNHIKIIAKETAGNVQTIINASGSQLQAMAEISRAVETMLRSVEDMKETIAVFRV